MKSFSFITQNAPYVGTHAALASAALIFWAFGRGQVHAAIKKFADLAFRIKRTAKTEMVNLATCTVERLSIDNWW